MAGKSPIVEALIYREDVLVTFADGAVARLTADMIHRLALATEALKRVPLEVPE